MSSITDELRKWASIEVPYKYGNQLTAIADRIDAEHERMFANLTVDMKPMTDENMAESGWVKLPTDADGEYIRIGDVMAYADNTKPMEVVALVPPAVFLTEDGPRYADMCRHYHAPTVEDVLREFALRVTGKDCMTARPEVLEEYAAKLQLREDA